MQTADPVRAAPDPDLADVELFDKSTAQSFSLHRGELTEYRQHWLSRFVELGQIRPGNRVADIGCGTGAYSRPLATVTRTPVLAIDPSAAMLDRAVLDSQNSGICFVRGRAEQIPLQSGHLDCVILAMVLHHLEKPNRATAEIARVLKPGGRVVIFTREIGEIERSVYSLFPGVVEVDRDRFPEVHEVQDWLKQGGFGPTEVIREPNPHRVRSYDELMVAVENKFITSLRLLDQEVFDAGLEVFKKGVRETYGDVVDDTSCFTIVSAEKL